MKDDCLRACHEYGKGGGKAHNKTKQYDSYESTSEGINGDQWYSTQISGLGFSRTRVGLQNSFLANSQLMLKLLVHGPHVE